MTKFFLIIMAYLASVITVYAGASPDLQNAIAFKDNFLKPAIEKIAMTHKQKDMEPGEKSRTYDAIISPLFDHSLTAKLTLEKEQWQKLTVDQQARFILLFGKRLQNFYLQRLLLLYPDTEILYRDTVQEINKAVVNTELKSSYLKTNREVQYKLRYADQEWKIYDINVNGISILKNYRAQFKKFLTRKTAEDLLKELENVE